MFEVLGTEPRDGAAKILRGKCGILAEPPGKHPFSQWTEGDKADPQLLQYGEKLFFWLTIPHGVFALHGSERTDGMSSPHGPRTGFRQAPVSNFSLPDESGHGFGHFFDRSIRVNSVLIVQVDIIRPQSFEGAFQRVSDMARTAGERNGPIVGVVLTVRKIKAELGSDDDILSVRLQGFSQQAFIAAGPVGFRRIEKGNSHRYGFSDDRYGFASGEVGRVTLGQPHTSIAKGRDLQSPAQHSLSHGMLLLTFPCARLRCGRYFPPPA